MLYDVLYLYQQFIGELPDTFLEFRSLWTEMFPLTYDTKVLTTNSNNFHRTDLGKAFEKCTLDGKMRGSNAKVSFDEEGAFERYRKSNSQKEDRLQESFYHEAAYDAHMTGIVFIQTLRFCEKRDLKASNSKSKGRKRGDSGVAEEEKKGEETDKKEYPNKTSSLQVEYEKGFARDCEN